MFGDREDDILTGGLSEDALSGADDSDVFALESVAGTDMIADFENGIDLI